MGALTQVLQMPSSSLSQALFLGRRWHHPQVLVAVQSSKISNRSTMHLEPVRCRTAPGVLSTGTLTRNAHHDKNKSRREAASGEVKGRGGRERRTPVARAGGPLPLPLRFVFCALALVSVMV